MSDANQESREAIRWECFSLLADIDFIKKLFERLRPNWNEKLKAKKQLYFGAKEIYERWHSGKRLLNPYEQMGENRFMYADTTNAPAVIEDIVWHQDQIINHCVLKAALAYVELIESINSVNAQNQRIIENAREKIINKDFLSAKTILNKIVTMKRLISEKKWLELENLRALHKEAFSELDRWRATFSEEERHKQFSFINHYQKERILSIGKVVGFGLEQISYILDIHSRGQKAVEEEIEFFDYQYSDFWEEFRKLNNLVDGFLGKMEISRKLHEGWAASSRQSS
jgi:hypothetical protein